MSLNPFVGPERAANGDATPPRTSRLLVTAVVGAGVLFVGSRTAVLEQVVDSAVAALVVAVALSLLNEDDPEPLAVGALLLVPAGAMLVGDLVAMASGPPVRALRAVALLVAVTGLAALWTGVVGNRSLATAVSRFGYALLPLSLAALMAMASKLGSVETAAVGGPVVGALWGELVAPTGRTLRVGDFLLLLAAASYAARAALARLPLVELAPERATDRRAEQVRRARVHLQRTYLVVAPLGVLVGGLTLLGTVPSGGPVGAVLGALDGIATAGALRWLLVVVAAVGAVAAAAAEAVLRVRDAAAADVTPRAVPFAAGVAVVLAVSVFTAPVITRVRARTPVAMAPVLEELIAVAGRGSVALLAVAGSAILFTALAGGVVLLARLGFLTDRVAPVSLASGGLFVGALITGIIGDGPLALYIGVAAATVAWDAGEFGVGVAEELGRKAWSRQGELVHAVASVAVAAAGVAGALALEGTMRRPVPEGSLVAVGAAAAFVGTVLLLSRVQS
ncbi:DUF7519 family protein [Halostella litorea]|uniref:DUF7519 family protein n=1 Tax=Halostella litorea TaxID=2528831 RepID=UPI001386A1CE|nr:hypothetical protein [Halostella litorea]